ncbi:unnamed protein product [Mytilus edulis]|uniref:Uncharacterized protein n=1 Tax=Mytilus edulis TaxID=6550 RepID=A0A8S3UCJ8_MYTED|nr:unnamed protein product [Mytilus edulis]
MCREETHDEHENGQNIYFVDVNESSEISFVDEGLKKPQIKMYDDHNVLTHQVENCMAETQPEMAHIKVLDHIPSIEIDKCMAETQPEMAHIKVLDHIRSIKVEKCMAETQPEMAHIEVLDHTPSTISHDFVEDKQFILVELGPPIELESTAEIVNTAEPSIEIKEEIILPRDLENDNI